MTRESASERVAAARLLAALERNDEMTHDMVRALLPALIEAERAGQDVDEQPRFAPLLAHLDACADCLDAYEQLAEEIAALLGEAPLPAALGTAPSFFTPARRDDRAILRVIKGLRRRFELTLTPPRLLPVASHTPAATIFSDQLTEVAGTPTVEALLDMQAAPPQFRVSVRETAGATRWQVRLVLDQQSFDAVTDAQGVATIVGFSAEHLRAATRLSLLYAEHETT